MSNREFPFVPSLQKIQVSPLHSLRHPEAQPGHAPEEDAPLHCQGNPEDQGDREQTATGKPEQTATDNPEQTEKPAVVRE